MSVQSSQRIKKVASHQLPHLASGISTAQGVTSRESAPRESTPSPSFREKQKITAKTLVMNLPQGYNQPPIRQQPSPTSSTGSRRSPPVSARISPTATTTKLSNASTHDVRDRDRSEDAPDRRPSPPIHSMSQPNIHLQLPPPPPQHSISQSNIHSTNNAHNAPHYPRPINRIPPPQFLNQYHPVDESWQMTNELMAEIERADIQQAQSQLSSPSGKSGVAYAGGAQSGPISKDLNVHRVTRGAPERVSPKEFVENNPVNTTARKVHRNSQSSLPPSSSPHSRTPEHRRSPSYPLSGEPSPQTYVHYEYEAFQAAQARIPTPSGLRKVETLRSSPTLQTSTTAKFSSAHTPPVQSIKAKSPDRSLPVQEEPEDDHHDYDPRLQSSPTPSSDVYPEGRPGYESKHLRGGRDSRGGRHLDDDDSATLNEDMDDDDDDDDDPVLKPSGRDDDSSGYTPRSPSATLPETGQPYHQTTIRTSRSRAGVTDQLGMRGFDPQMFEQTFEQTVEKLRGPGTVINSPTTTANLTSNRAPPPAAQAKEQYGQQQFQYQYPQQQQQQQLPQQLPQQQRPQQRPQVSTQGYYPPPQFYPEDFQSFLEDPTSAYLQAYLQSPGTRPQAPIPPTPHSQTAAPTPAPSISAVPDLERLRSIGSPYPYPFSHVRRNTYSARPPSAAFDPNDPAVIREQMALQMQIYALNNAAAMSSTESNFSPSATPFPAPGYNPWAFVPAVRGFPGLGGGAGGIIGGGVGGGRGRDSTMSLRSSPSHEPLPLPLPPMMMKGSQGRLRRRERSVNLKAAQDRMMNGGRSGRSKLAPPRVDSTQPRDTSPEMTYSGEETAGEDDYNHEGLVDAKEVNGLNDVGGTEVAITDEVLKFPEVNGEEGDWIDEDEDDDDGNDLLDLTLHPTYVRDDQKRRRRWETRWEALSEAFRALDRQTDTTMILLAAPPHTRKLHSLMSRSIRRDSSIVGSPSVSNIRKSFHQVNSLRRATKMSHSIPLVDRLGLRSREGSTSVDSGPGSESSSESREEDLRRALEAALGSLETLGSIYDQRETRWREEMRKLNTDRESVEVLLTRAFGQLRVAAAPSVTNVNGSPEKEQVAE